MSSGLRWPLTVASPVCAPGSDLKIFLTWCAGQGLDPLRVGRADVERYVRWPQEVRWYQP